MAAEMLSASNGCCRFEPFMFSVRYNYDDRLTDLAIDQALRALSDEEGRDARRLRPDLLGDFNRT